MITISETIDYFIIQTSTRKETKELELLLLARSIPFTLQNQYWRKVFFIPIQFKETAQKELLAFADENRNWPPPAPKAVNPGFRFSFLVLFGVVCLAVFHWNISRVDPMASWLESGKFLADRVLNGEWWRLITANTLHVDDAHLISNFFGLLLFVSGVNYYLGPGFSWFMVLLSAALGNYFNALLYQIGHPSIGASTAVFGAVGLIATFGIRTYYHRREIRGRIVFPLVAGLGLFAMLGTNPESDVTAHLFGFAAGILVGMPLLPLIGSKLLLRKSFQILMLCGFGFVLFQSWVLALQP